MADLVSYGTFIMPSTLKPRGGIHPAAIVQLKKAFKGLPITTKKPRILGCRLNYENAVLCSAIDLFRQKEKKAFCKEEMMALFAFLSCGQIGFQIKATAMDSKSVQFIFFPLWSKSYFRMWNTFAFPALVWIGGRIACDLWRWSVFEGSSFDSLSSNLHAKENAIQSRRSWSVIQENHPREKSAKFKKWVTLTMALKSNINTDKTPIRFFSTVPSAGHFHAWTWINPWLPLLSCST